MTPVSEIAAQHDDVKPVIENGELQWVTQMKQWSTIEDEIDLYVFDLSRRPDQQGRYPDGCGQSLGYRATAVAGTRRQGDAQHMVPTRISAGNERTAYALADRAAYLAGSTDYTPIAMYTGD